MKQAYLSIDLDFWKEHCDSRSSTNFFNKVFALNVPMLFVIEHEELLKDINKSKTNVLYNVDYHSDLCSNNELKKNEKPTDGSWVNYVTWQKKGEYYWICPSYEMCYEEQNGTCCGTKGLDPFKHKKESTWKSIEVTQKLNTIDWRTIKKIGVCLSPCFLDPKTVRGVTNKLGIDKNEIKDLMKTQVYDDPKFRVRGILKEIA